MSVVLSITKKELKGFLFSPGFLLVFGLFTLILSWFYPNLLIAFAKQSAAAIFGGDPRAGNINLMVFQQYISLINLLFLFMIPALTMKLFSEERKLRTFDLLLTSPITSWQIVVGKFLAAAGAIAIILLVAFLYPAVTGIFVSFHWPSLIVGFAGLLGLALIYLAMGLFASSLTENSILALFLALILNLLLFFVQIGAETADSQVARSVFEHLSVGTHFRGFLEGSVRTTGLVFFASVIVLFCFLTERVVESFRWR